ncbi:MAG: hypothetical protein C4294_13505, partial [Nitrospiraceae bacterium]
MIRLAELPVDPSSVNFESHCEGVARLEEEYRREFVPHIQKLGQGMPPEDYFRWAEELRRIRPQVQGLEHWEAIETQLIAPHINHVLRALTQYFSGDLAEHWQSWRDRYLPELITLLRELRREASVK